MEDSAELTIFVLHLYTFSSISHTHIIRTGISQQQEALEKLYQDFQELHKDTPFFRKDFTFEAFALYAYKHHHFDKATALSLIPPSTPSSLSSFSDLSYSDELPSEERMNPRHGIRAYRTIEDQKAGEPDQLLFFGIIDLLVPFDSRKKGEYVLKSMYHGGKQHFSVIPPSDYRERFYKFITDAIV